MADTVLVRPRMGLILAEVPASGAAIPRALAEEWIANRMIEPGANPVPRRHLGALVSPVVVGVSGPETTPVKAPVHRRRRKAATAASRRRSTK